MLSAGAQRGSRSTPTSMERIDPARRPGAMDGLAHIFLHVGLCGSVARLPESTAVPVHVVMAYAHGDPPYDKKLTIPRGDGTEWVIEFDVPRAEYHVTVDVPKYKCASSSFAQVFADQNRKIDVTLSEAPPPELPVLLLDGTAPTSFLYLKPTYVLFETGLKCDDPVTTQLPTHIDVDYDQGAYYMTMFASPQPPPLAPVFAIRLRTPTGLAHYVRLPIKLPSLVGGWPSNIQFNISEDMIDGLATDKTGVLLCPKIWGTSAG